MADDTDDDMRPEYDFTGAVRGKHYKAFVYNRYWRIRKYLPERFGQRCRVVVYGRRLNSCLVEFEDGSRYVTIRHFVSPTPPKPPRQTQPSLFAS